VALNESEFVVLNGGLEEAAGDRMTAAEVAELFGDLRSVPTAIPQSAVAASAAAPPPAPAPPSPAPAAPVHRRRAAPAQVLPRPVHRGHRRAGRPHREPPALAPATAVRRSLTAVWVRRATGSLLAASLLLGWAALALAVAQHVYGFETFTVLTGSMRPAIPVGALVVEHKVPASSIKVGDVITFHPSTDPGIVITHRVIQVRTLTVAGVDKRYFVTQGDANPVPDPGGVPAAGDIGRVDASYPYAGYVTWFLQQPLVRTALLLLPLLLMATLVIEYAWPRRRRA
jgi:signal peptidase